MVTRHMLHIHGMNTSKITTAVSGVTLPTKTAYYYVDESGDGVLFGKSGRIAIGAGALTHFILGLLEVNDPVALTRDLDELRKQLLADPYFKDVPSFQPQQFKTAHAFHAKDDVPEVRREVYRVLARHDIKFFAVVRDMRAVLAYVQERNRRGDDYRYKPNELYDQTVARLFKDRLHQHEVCNVCFARRGPKDRTAAIRSALDVAAKRFTQKWGIAVDSQIELSASTPAQTTCLQAVDYWLWALQRYYAHGEQRFVHLLWHQVGLIHAVDEIDAAPYGVYYSKKKPLPDLTGAAL
jgi:hypothetical protein